MVLTGADVAKHGNREDCWVIVHVHAPIAPVLRHVADRLQGKAYDVTEFLPEHPGGPKIILKYAVSLRF